MTHYAYRTNEYNISEYTKDIEIQYIVLEPSFGKLCKNKLNINIKSKVPAQGGGRGAKFKKGGDSNGKPCCTLTVQQVILNIIKSIHLFSSCIFSQDYAPPFHQLKFLILNFKI